MRIEREWKEKGETRGACGKEDENRGSRTGKMIVRVVDEEKGKPNLGSKDHALYLTSLFSLFQLINAVFSC